MVGIITIADTCLFCFLVFSFFPSWRFFFLILREFKYFQQDTYLGICSRLRLASYSTWSLRQFLILPRRAAL